MVEFDLETSARRFKAFRQKDDDRLAHQAYVLGIRMDQLVSLQKAFKVGISGADRNKSGWVDEMREIRRLIGPEETLGVLARFTGRDFPEGTTLIGALRRLRDENPMCPPESKLPYKDLPGVKL